MLSTQRLVHFPGGKATSVVRHGLEQRLCANLGPCVTGCARGAKSSTDVTYWPVALRAGGERRTHCRVREVLVDDDGMATGVIYYDDKGIEHRQRAHVVVLACNGVGTPRLLLNSRSRAFPEGLANRSGLVGKNLMLHPWGMVRGTFASGEAGNIGAHPGPSSCAIWSQQFYETDASRDFVRGYNLQITRGQGPASTARYLLGHGALPWGADHHRELRRHSGNMIGSGVCCEGLPEELNRVTLDPTLTDSSGIPAPKITYRLGENSRRMLHHGVSRAVEALQAADPAKMGQVVGDVPITEIGKLVPTVRRKKVKIAVVAVPAAAAQSVADLLVEAGVTAILNFAPAQLTVPDGVKVQNVDLSVLLKTLSYHTVRTSRSGPQRTEPRLPGPS